MVNTEIMNSRSNPHIDPALSLWNWEIPGYLFLGGLTAGLLVLSGIFYLRRRKHDMPATMHIAPALAPPILAVGMLFLFLDLEHKLYTYNLYVTFQWTSPMSWGAWALILIFPVSIYFALVQLRSTDREIIGEYLFSVPLAGDRLKTLFIKATELADKYDRFMKPAAYINIVMGGFIGIYTGILLSSYVSRPFWNTPLLGFLFLSSGLSGAAALIMLLSKDENEEQVLLRVDIAFLIVELFILTQIFIGMGTSSVSHNEAGRMIFGGPYTGVFWMLVVLQGLLFPLFMEIMELKKKFHFRYVTPLSVLVGGLLLRIVFVYLGQASHI